MKQLVDLVPIAFSSCISALSSRRATNCIWELTYRCNASCKMCSYWRNPIDQGKELKLADFRRGIEKIRQYGCRFINFSGGEPTMRSDLEDIVSCASQRGIFTSMVTNGSLLTKSRVNQLKEAGLDNLFLSLDSVDSCRHDTLRGIQGLHDSVRGMLAYIGDNFISGHRTAGIMCVVSRLNLGELEEMVQMARELKVYIEFQLYHDRKMYRDRKTGEQALNTSEVFDVVQTLMELKRRYWNVISLQPYLKGMPNYRSDAPPQCFAGNKYFSIDPYGYLHPCVDLPSVGHLLHDDMSVLQNANAQAFIDHCSGCWYCFRGEADVSFSVHGCLRRASQYAGILYHNQTKNLVTGLK